MARLAWFSPMPPARSGVAIYSAEVVAALRSTHLVHVFVDEPIAAAARAAGVAPEAIRSAHDFVWLNQQTRYDLTIYQLGNSSAHDFVWPYLYRYPGLAVLHDVHLHHARAASLLRQHRADAYRDEFKTCHPDVSPDAAELAVHGFDSHLYYAWPMTRSVVAASLVTATHSPCTATALRDEHPGASIERIRLGHGTVVSAAGRAGLRQVIRRRHGIGADAVVFGVFGGMTPEKRIPQILTAFEATRAHVPGAHLLLVGGAAEHYDLRRDVARRALDAAVTIAGYVEDDEFTSYLAAVDVSLNLRWPTAREVSGPWVRALAAGCATVTTDLWHTADVPGLDPRSWNVVHGSPTLSPPRPVTVKIDILDEDHSLRLAMRRLAVDAALREELARAGLDWWQAEHAHDAMLADYHRAIALALATPDQEAEHAASRGEIRLRELLAPFGIPESPWSRI